MALESVTIINGINRNAFLDLDYEEVSDRIRDIFS
jgi:hypothetical protein